MSYSNKDKIYELLKHIHNLIEENENENGTFRFDSLRAVIALDFAKTEIEKTINR